VAVFLLTYNALKGGWESRDDDLREFARAGEAERVVKGRWSIARKHDIGPGDEVYLLRQRFKPRGILASGFVASAPYPDDDWEKPGEMCDYVDVDWSRAVSFTDPLRLGDLKRVSPKQHWTPQQSGIELRSEYIRAVADLWETHTRKRRRW